MSAENLELWRKVEKTDPSATKDATVSGQKITSISGQHMIMKATEMFGPVGIGWGWTVIEERFDQGGPIFREVKDQAGTRQEQIGNEVGHTVRIKLWFKTNGERGEVEQYGCTPFAYKSKWGVTTDTEAPKKSLTDAIKKALAMLGFSADIFLGLFDDRDYVEQRHAEEAIARAEDQDAEIERQRKERLEWLEKALLEMQAAPHMHALTALYKRYVRQASNRNEANFERRLAKEFEDLKAKLEDKSA